MKPSILLVEDDTFILNLYKAKFTDKAVDVLVATDGEQAIKLMEKRRSSIVLLDLILPKLDGFDVLQYMHENPSLQDVPVIVLTNLGQEIDKKRALELGAKKFLVKTDISLASVVDMVKSFLSEEQTKNAQ